jgi:hypothetical protein
MFIAAYGDALLPSSNANSLEYSEFLGIDMATGAPLLGK